MPQQVRSGVGGELPHQKQNDVGNYGPRLPGVGGDMPQQVRSGVGGELPHQKRKSGVGSNIPQQIGSVSKSDTRPDRGNLALSIAYSDVECYDVKEQLSWGCDTGTAWYV